MARLVCLAVSTMRRLMTWLMARWWRFLPDSRFKSRLLFLVPLAWAERRTLG